jgi:hypothetical protein
MNTDAHEFRAGELRVLASQEPSGAGGFPLSKASRPSSSLQPKLR